MISTLVTLLLLLAASTMAASVAKAETTAPSNPDVMADCTVSGDGKGYYDCIYKYYVSCFPGDATIKLQDGTTKTMETLSIGDTVQTWDPSSGDILWSKVQLFLDHNPNMTSAFVVIETEKDDKMALTARHLVPVREGADLQWKWAEHIVVGDEVHNVDGWVRVSKVASRVAQGVYAPLTSAGTLMVDGVAASCFAVVQAHEVAYWATKPAVWMAQWFGESVQQGIHWYSRLLLDHAWPMASGLMTR